MFRHGIGLDGNGYSHQITEFGGGFAIGGGLNGTDDIGDPNYINGWSGGLACSVSTPIPGVGGDVETGWSGSTLSKPLLNGGTSWPEGGGGGGTSWGVGEGCSAMASYTGPG